MIYVYKKKIINLFLYKKTINYKYKKLIKLS